MIGREVALRMAQDYQVTSLDISPQSSTNIPYKKTDITDPATLELIVSLKPDVIVNCINIATIFSGSPAQNYSKLIAFYLELYKTLKQLDPPIQYIQIGTTGSGGLGLDIPFTHGERLENLPIINKAAFAGIGTSMLTLLSRSFGDKDVRVCEIKPGLAIFDSEMHSSSAEGWHTVTLRGGESGNYTYNELALLTRFMGFSTAQRIAEKVLSVIRKKDGEKLPLSYDVINALNQTIITQDKEDAAIRDSLLERMEEASRGESIIATGNLGPPSLTRDLILGSIVIKNNCQDESEFKKVFAESESCKQTLAYISSINENLGVYLKTECNYQNYLEQMKQYGNHRFIHVWELVAERLKPAIQSQS